MIFSVKSFNPFEPSANVDVSTAQVAYQTPAPWRHSLGGMGLMNGVKAELKYKCKRVSGAADVSIEIRVKTAGGIVVHTEIVTIAASAIIHGKSEIDVGAVGSASPLLIEVQVTAADAGEAVTLDAGIEYETPVVIGGC